MTKSMPNIRIDTGELRIMINDDPDRVIVFNPEDHIFIEKFYKLTEKLNKYHERMTDLLTDDLPNPETELPANSEKRIALLSEASVYIRGQVDDLFGENAAQNVFGSATSLDAFAQFVEGVTPYVKNIREGKVKKYTAKKVSKKTSAKTKAG